MSAVMVHPRFGRVAESGSLRRLHTTRVAYGSGAAAVALGLLTGLTGLLALGALLVNVGTIERFLAVALDLETVDVPLLPLRPSPA